MIQGHHFSKATGLRWREWRFDLIVRLSVTIVALSALHSLTPAQTHLEQGNNAYGQGDYTGAAGLYRKAIAADENPALAWYNLGNTLYQMDTLPGAITSYLAAVREAPDFFRPYLNLGILYFNLGDLASTIAVLTRARLLEPANTQAIMILAAARQRLGDLAGASVLLEQVAERDSAVDDTWFMLYDIYRELQDWRGARRWLERYSDNGPRAADKFQFLGELEEQHGENERAVLWYRKALERAPQRMWVRVRLTRLLALQGTTLTALAFARESLEQHDSFHELALVAGGIAFDKGYLRDAEYFFAYAYRKGSADGLVGLQNLITLYDSQADKSGLARVHSLLGY